jgi:hypothetical protein
MWTPNWSRSTVLIVTTLLKSSSTNRMALSRQRLVHMYKRETSGGFWPLSRLFSVEYGSVRKMILTHAEVTGEMLASFKIIFRALHWRVHTTGLVVSCPTHYRSLVLKICSSIMQFLCHRNLCLTPHICNSELSFEETNYGNSSIYHKFLRNLSVRSTPEIDNSIRCNHALVI